MRRIVTLEEADGSVTLLADGAAENVTELNGSIITRLWETGPVPVSLNVTGDAGATAGNAYREGFQGTSLYIADIPPGTSLEDIPMHKQDSLDYIAVLSGQINLILPDQTLAMKPGDVLVQAGNLHSWTNTSDETCRLLVVVLTGKR